MSHSSVATKNHKSHTLPPLLSHSSLLKSGWCLKESGSSFLGSKNWRRRLFLLTEYQGAITLTYFKSPSDDLPAGVIPLDRTYATRHIELTVKGKLHCFAVGPLVEDGSSRTYYMCCMGDLEKKEWMTAIEAAIEGTSPQTVQNGNTVKPPLGNTSTWGTPFLGPDFLLSFRQTSYQGTPPY